MVILASRQQMAISDFAIERGVVIYRLLDLSVDVM